MPGCSCAPGVLPWRVIRAAARLEDVDAAWVWLFLSELAVWCGVAGCE